VSKVILDTNIVLDTFVFGDDAAAPLRAGLETGALRWMATQAMRDELERVLGYPKIVPRLAFHGLEAAAVMAAFDRHAGIVDTPPKAPVTCKDADDQKFIDLALAHGALLLSKDKHVLATARRLALRGAAVRMRLAAPAQQADQAMLPALLK